MRIALFCLASSLVLISFFNLDALVAPVMKMLFYCKVFFLKTIPGWFAASVVAVKKGLLKMTLLLGNWEAWSFKKLIRHFVRFVVTYSARIVILTFLINLFLGRERKGIKNMPRFITFKLRSTWVGRVIDWWKNTSERARRIITGIVLCLILVAVGQTFIGISILVFDLVWEALIVLASVLARLWRWVMPIIVRLIPNAIGAFFTNSVIPFFVNVVPYIRDDLRILYVRMNIRERYREYKKRLLKFSRAKRPQLRDSIRPLLGSHIRERKNAILDEAAKHDEQD